jgi:3-oxoacyl-[acyl-carrier-protein] synthase-3
MHAEIRAVDYHLPDVELTNADIARDFPDWSIEKVVEKTGILSRRLSREGEFASDLAVRAARKLFDRGACDPKDVDFLLLCTQSPDYFLPTTACLLQNELGIPTTAGALDFNLGCSGFVYGLGLAKGLIVSGQASRVLLLTAETYSKFLAPDDRSVRTIFGDAAAATLIEAAPDDGVERIGPFEYGTDGGGAENLIVRNGGARNPAGPDAPIALYMNGPEIFSFTLRAVPDCLNRLLQKAEIQPDDVDLFVFHQANKYMLDHLREKTRIPTEKFFVGMERCGNTVSATIPIALRQAQQQGVLRPGMTVALVGFGVGYSWGAVVVRWTAASDH